MIKLLITDQFGTRVTRLLTPTFAQRVAEIIRGREGTTVEVFEVV